MRIGIFSWLSVSYHQFFLMASAFCVLFKKSFPTPIAKRYSLLLSNSFNFTLESVVYLIIAFCVWCEVVVKFNFFLIWICLNWVPLSISTALESTCEPFILICWSIWISLGQYHTLLITEAKYPSGYCGRACPLVFGSLFQEILVLCLFN